MSDLTHLEMWPGGVSRMARAIRDHDWAATPLGSTATWSSSLKVAVESMLANPCPVTLHWGDSLILLFNDPFLPLAPPPGFSALGRPTFAVFAPVATQIEFVMRRVRSGESFVLDDQHFHRSVDGIVEECWYDLSHQPVWGDHGTVAGVTVTGVDTTDRVRAERGRRR